MSHIWYCCRVVDAAPLQNRINGAHFRTGQYAYCSQVDEASWLLFDGRRYAAVVSTDQAKEALQTQRDRQGLRVRAPAATERRYQRAIYGQTGRLTRRGRRFV